MLQWQASHLPPSQQLACFGFFGTDVSMMRARLGLLAESCLVVDR